MLKSKIGYSINENSYDAGISAMKMITEEQKNSKVCFLYTSEKNNVKEVVRGVQETTNAPIIGCTSSGGIIAQDGIINSENGFVGIMGLSDSNLKIGVACHEAGKDARIIGRKVAIQAVENAKTTRAPAAQRLPPAPPSPPRYHARSDTVCGW